MKIISNFTEFESNNEHKSSNLYLIYEDCEINTDFDSTKNYLTISFKNCTFNNFVKFKCEFDTKFSFIDCTFNEVVDFKHCIFNTNVEIINCNFHSKVDFSNAIFNFKIRFYNSKFYNLILFNNTLFKDLADFWNAEFYKPIIFYKTDFLGTTVFASAEFHENVLFTYTLIEKLIIFRGTIFKKGLDISLSILSGKISIFDIGIKNFNSVPDLERENDNLYEENVSKNAIINDKNKRETFRILKNELLSQGNNIDSLLFSNLELKSYAEILKRKIKKRKKWYKTIQDYTILFLNECSNEQGKSWWRGIIFTFSVGLIFYYLSIISTEKYCFGIPYNFTVDDYKKNLGYYFISMSPTHEQKYMNDEIPQAFFYFWDFVGRAFIAYGIYQTVQAFRKFKK